MLSERLRGGCCSRELAWVLRTRGETNKEGLAMTTLAIRVAEINDASSHTVGFECQDAPSMS